MSAGIETAVKLHISRGDDLECRDEKGFTPLMIAASRNRAGVCGLLIGAGANVSAVDSAGRDALMIARECGAFAAAETIAEYVANREALQAGPREISKSVDGTELPTSALEGLNVSGDRKMEAAADSPSADLAHGASHEASSRQAPTNSVATGKGSLANLAGENVPIRRTEGNTELTSVSSTIGTEASHGETVSPMHPPTGCMLNQAGPLAVESVMAGGGDLCESDAQQSSKERPLLLSPSSDVQAGNCEPSDELSDGSNSRNRENRPLVELTFGDWEVVEISEPPHGDPTVTMSTAERQRRIDSHTPIDQSAVWDDFEVFLPESAKPQPRASDQGFREVLRELLLRALREGSIPRVAIEDVMSSRADGEERDLHAETALEFVLEDMGAEADERLEFQSAIPSENFKVIVDPVETESEEAEVDEAILYFEELLSDKNDPLRIYHRAAVKRSLLSAEQEIDCARKMENAISRALDALAKWPLGLNRLLAETHKAAGTSHLSTIVVVRGDDSDDIDRDADPDEFADAIPDVESDLKENSAQAELLDQEESLGAVDDPIEILASIQATVAESTEVATPVSLRHELGRLRFRRPFLIRLEEVAKGDTHPDASAYRSAIAELIRYRDHMMQANLRLVMDIARRRMHSGLRLEDLIQEGNLGLLKAVDRFDWRRGFRFSTMAIWWIKQQIGRGIFDTALEIRLPVHIHQKISRGRRETESFERARGKPASLAERATICNMTPDKFELAARALSEPLSIEGAQQVGYLKSEESDEPFACMSEGDDARLVEEILKKLKPKDAEVLRLRFGIGVLEALTLEQIGEILGVTRERVRQIEAAAMQKLSSPFSRETLMKALGRVQPQRKRQSDDEEARTKSNASHKNSAKTRSNESKSTREIAKDVDSARWTNVMSALPPEEVDRPISASMQRLLDAARELGVRVTQDPSGSNAGFIFSEIDHRDSKGRKLIRDLLGTGFTWQPGIGYRR
ncbi:sigma-70 family RNA polymerase sigma factor [Ralstonia solanacearum]|uniref:sigma-70 family RNA polymerase sigma factor n=1 Tax=Ralstonia solanacearum TaxID=305 RepID=UPI0018D12519|nr:sigma-70 family RNA polymerase sigma factor [Ralstonia solanacearum]